MESQATNISVERKRQALHQVLESRTLSRSDQLRNFLRYVAEMEIAGRGAGINEYLIGVEALGRPSGYSPGEDSSVRSRAYELRQKLQKFYELECPQYDLRIELAKGSYVPRFIERATLNVGESIPTHPTYDVVPLATVHKIPALHLKRGIQPGLMAFVAGMLVALALGALAWPWLNKLSRKPDAIVADAWGPLLQPDANVLVCLGTNLFLIIRPFLPPLGADVQRYPAPPELYSAFRSHRPLPAGTKLEMHPTENDVAFGELQGVLQAAATLQQAGARYEVLPEQSAPLAAMHGRNVILFGVSFSSQATTDLLADFPLQIEYDQTSSDIIIRDHAGSRKYVPERDADNRYNILYGLITVRDDGLHRTVVISGITSFGSEGAMDFFASPDSLRELRTRLMKDGARGFPSAYQAVVRCTASNLYHPCQLADVRILHR